jgi:hypothetical protein
MAYILTIIQYLLQSSERQLGLGKYRLKQNEISMYIGRRILQVKRFLPRPPFCNSTKFTRVLWSICQLVFCAVHVGRISRDVSLQAACPRPRWAKHVVVRQIDNFR